MIVFFLVSFLFLTESSLLKWSNFRRRYVDEKKKNGKKRKQESKIIYFSSTNKELISSPGLCRVNFRDTWGESVFFVSRFASSVFQSKLLGTQTRIVRNSRATFFPLCLQRLKQQLRSVCRLIIVVGLRFISFFSAFFFLLLFSPNKASSSYVTA